MRRVPALLLTGVLLSSLAPNVVPAEELKGADRREYERLTSEGSFSTSCSATAEYTALWAGEKPSVLEIDGKQRPVQFEAHKVGDYIKTPFRCQTADGPLTIKMKLTHSISNSECGAANVFIATVSVAHLGSYSDDFLVDGCAGTTGLVIRGKQVLLCRMDDSDKSAVGRCGEATDGPGPRRLH